MKNKKMESVVILFLMTVSMCLFPSFAGAELNKEGADKQGFVWMQDLEKARAKATVEKKPLFVMFRCEP